MFAGSQSRVCNAPDPRRPVMSGAPYLSQRCIALPVLFQEDDGNWGWLISAPSLRETSLRARECLILNKPDKFALCMEESSRGDFVCLLPSSTARELFAREFILRTVMFHETDFSRRINILSKVNGLHFVSGSLYHIARIGLSQAELRVLSDMQVKDAHGWTQLLFWRELYMRNRVFAMMMYFEQDLQRRVYWEKFIEDRGGLPRHLPRPKSTTPPAAFTFGLSDTKCRLKPIKPLAEIPFSKTAAFEIRVIEPFRQYESIHLLQIPNN